MKIAPLTPDENARLNALYGYNILDTESEKVFDDLTQLASEICQTPIALISLIDPKRQWFKSKVGLDANETNRDIAFCAHAIHEQKIFEVCDTLKDERFHDNPLVTGDPNIRFYAGAQLVTPSGHAIGTLCAISDQPKKLTASQINALEILSREVITQLELRRNLQIAQQESLFKTEFLSSISHEIRTPLNAIIGFSKILLEKSEQLNLPADFKNHLEDIDFSSLHLLGIVNSVLDLSKIEAGKMEINNNWFESHAFIKQLCKMMSVKAKERRVKLNFDIDNNLPDYLFMDEGKLSQVIINLLNNAIKFTPANKSVFLCVQFLKNKLQITIKDQGIGINKKDQTRLFSKFKQVGEHKHEGTGLGLVITKNFVELMAGEIQLESEIDIGTIVTTIIPINNTQASEQPRLKETSAHKLSNSQPNILVVEDNAINRKLASIMFMNLGHQVDFAINGESSITMVNENSYDIVFMDIHLPGISGIDAAKSIRNKCPLLPIIALTADIFQSQQPNNNNFIFDSYLSKPLLKEELSETLYKLI